MPPRPWARLGRTWAAFGQLLGAPGRLLGTFCALLEHSWSHLGSHGCLQPRFGRLVGASSLGAGEFQWQFSPWFLAMPLACRHGFYIMHGLLEELLISIS